MADDIIEKQKKLEESLKKLAEQTLESLNQGVSGFSSLFDQLQKKAKKAVDEQNELINRSISEKQNSIKQIEADWSSSFGRQTAERDQIDMEIKRIQEEINDLTSQRIRYEEESVKWLSEKIKKYEKWKDIYKDITGPLSSELTGSLDKISALSIKIFNTESGILRLRMMSYQFLIMAIDRWAELDKAAEKFRRETGIMTSQMDELWWSTKNISRDFAGYGVTVEDVYKSASGLLSTFNVMAATNKDNLEYVSLMQANLGISETTSSKILQKFIGISKLSVQGAKNLTIAISNLAQASGVAFKTILEDIDKISGAAIGLFRGSAQEMAKAAVQARKMGIELGTATRSAESLLDFTSSVNKEMEASVLLGTSVNLQRMRELAYRGDITGMMEEQKRVIAELGGLHGKDYFQLRAMADALGMQLDDIMKMKAQEDLLAEARRESGAAFIDDYNKQLKAAQELNDVEGKSATERLKQNLKQQQMQAKQTQLTNQLKQIWVSLADILVPIVEGLAAFLTIIVPIVKYTMLWGTAIKDVYEKLTGSKVSEGFNKWGVALINLLGITILFNGGIKKTISLLWDAGKAAYKYAAGLFKIGKATNAISNVPNAKTSGAGGGMFGSIKKGLSSLGRSAKSLLAGIGVILALSAAMWVFSKAIQNVKDVDWKIIATMGAVMIGLTLAVAALGAAFTGPQAAALGVGVLIIIAIAGAVWIFGKAIQAVAPHMKEMGEGLGYVADGMKKLWPYMLGGNVLAIGALGLAGSIMSLGLAAMMWSGQISKLADSFSKISASADGIFKMSAAVKELSISLKELKKVEDVVIKMEKAYANVESVSVPKTTSRQTMMQQTVDTSEKLNGVIAAVDRLNANLLAGKIAVYMDGQKVTDTLARNNANVGSKNPASTTDTMSYRNAARA